jgi:hypothetical protein
VGLRLGIGCGIALTIGCWLVTFGLTWLPGAFTAQALGVVPDSSTHVSTGPRLAAALFAPWLLDEHLTIAGVDVSERSVSLLGAAVVLVLLVAVGLVVRRATRSLRSRLIALLVAALGTATALAVAAAFVSYKVGDAGGGTATVSHDASGMFWIALLVIVTVGPFSFGVVKLLHPPVRVALQTAAVIVGLIAVTAAVAFSVVVVSWSPINQTGRVYWSTDLARVLGHWGAGISTVAVPLAFGARGHLPVVAQLSSPFTASVSQPTTSPDDNLRLPTLTKYMVAHPNARLTGYAATGGTVAHVLILVAAAFTLILFVLATLRAMRTLGAPRTTDGLRNGLLIGLVAFLFVVFFKLLGTLVLRIDAHNAGNAELRWGLDAGPLFQTGGELLALCGLSGLIYAALKPTAYRYRPWRAPISLHLPPSTLDDDAAAARTPSPSDATADTEPASPETPPPTLERLYCRQCGAPLAHGAAFCSQCGTRSDSQDVQGPQGAPDPPDGSSTRSTGSLE